MSSFSANQIRNTYVPFIQNVGERGLASFTATPGVPTYEIINQYNEDTRKELIIGILETTINSHYVVLRNTFNSPVTIKSDAATTTETTYLSIYVQGYNLVLPDLTDNGDWNTIVELPSSLSETNRMLPVSNSTGGVDIHCPYYGVSTSEFGGTTYIIIKVTYFTNSQKEYYKTGTILTA